MFDIEAVLQYLNSVSSAFLSGTDGREVGNRLNYIQSKRKDSKLYLAVIGEFSSGKSTFINALLGFRLLKEAVMPTTACATYIECHSKQLSIKVTFFDGQRFSATESAFDELKDYIYIKYNQISENLPQIITILTSDQKVARNVKNLNVKVPGSAIPKNIVIIDTPGFNPGSSSVDNHQEITRYVVENVADAAIVLTSQEQAMSATLSRFLKKNLSRCLHRCTYVVTKLDTLDDIEARKEVLGFVRQRIITDLGVSNPHLCGLSAVTMLPVKQIPLGKEEEWPILRKDFIDFKNRTWSNLKKSKEYVLSEHVNIIVKDVVNLCADKLNTQKEELQKNKLFLEKHRVEAIQSVCAKMQTSALKEINESFSRIFVSFMMAENNSIEKSKNIINSEVMSLANFKTSMMRKIEDAVEEEARKALQSLGSSINNSVSMIIKAQINKMTDVFASHYSQFPSLKPKENVPSINLINFERPNLRFSIALTKIEELEKVENHAAGGGAAVGAGLGFMIFGPIGAAVGAAVGGCVGLGAGDQSDEMRSSAIPIVQNEISSFYSTLKLKVKDEIQHLKLRFEVLINDFVREHILKYGNAVQKMIEEHKKKIEMMNRQITSLRQSIASLENINNEVELELTMLKNK